MSVAVRLGYIFVVLSMVVLTYVFAALGIVLGVFNLLRKEKMHGIIQIVLSMLMFVNAILFDVYIDKLLERFVV